MDNLKIGQLKQSFEKKKKMTYHTGLRFKVLWQTSDIDRGDDGHLVRCDIRDWRFLIYLKSYT